MTEVHETIEFARWLSRLRDERAADRIKIRIRRLSLGNPGDVKSVGRGISEMRVDHGPGYRVYFKRHFMRVTILLCGGTKSTQAADIRRAYQLADALQED